MKKLLIFTTLLGTLSLGACSRKATCPAYSSLQKPVPATTQAHV